MPRPPKGSTRAEGGREIEPVSRLATLKEEKAAIPLPPNPLPHIVAWLLEIGLSEPAGMGVAPVSWSTIDVWQRVTNVSLEPWEARLLRSLSGAYVGESRRAENETCPPPWSGTTRVHQATGKVVRLRDMFR